MRDRFSLNNLSEAQDWLDNTMLTQKRCGNNRILESTNLKNLIYKSFNHEDTAFRNFIQDGCKNLPDLDDLAKDAFTAMFSPVVQKNAEPEISDRAKAFNKPVIDGLLKHDSYGMLKSLCEDKELPAYNAATAFCREAVQQLSETPTATKPCMYLITVIETLSDQVENLINSLQFSKGKNGNNGKRFIFTVNQIYKKLSQIENLKKKISECVIKYSVSLKDVINDAVMAAIQKAEETCAVLTAWGTDDGSMRNTLQNKELLEHVKNSERLADMAHTLGKYREILANKRKNGFSYGLGEKYDITTGDDINACLSSELAMLGTPETKILFMQKFQQKQLMQYRKRAGIVKGDGDMIVLVDESLSTRMLAGWAKAFALALLDIAAKGKRKFSLIHFSSKDQVKVDLFEPGHYSNHDVMDAAEHFFDGGTDFEAPLKAALELLHMGYENADITMITDGECKISDKFAETFRQAKLMQKVTMTGILLDKNAPCGESLETFCDMIYHSKELSEDEIALDILNRSA